MGCRMGPFRSGGIPQDARAGIQAPDRLDLVLPMSPGRIERHGFECYRHGTLSPVYSSWPNQVEIWFQRIERDVMIVRFVFPAVRDLARKLMRYIWAYSKPARPFDWKYS